MKIKILLIVFIQLLYSCVVQQTKITLNLNKSGNYVDSVKINDLNKYFRDIENPEDITLKIIAGPFIKTKRFTEAVELSKQIKFKETILSVERND